MTCGSAHGCACVRDILPDADATLLNAIMHLTPPPNVLERICIPRRQLACGKQAGRGTQKRTKTVCRAFGTANNGLIPGKAAPKNTGKGKKNETPFSCISCLEWRRCGRTAQTCWGYLACRHRAGRVMLWFPRKFVSWCPCDRRRCVFSGRLPPPKAL